MSITNELKSLDKTTMMHIAGEAIVVIGLVFYFSNKNKRLTSHIEELAQRIEEQEDQIQKLENSLSQINNVLSKLLHRMETPNNNLSQSQLNDNTISIKKKKNVVQTPVVQTPVVQTPVVQTPVVQTPVVQTPVVQTPVIVSAFPLNFSKDKKQVNQIKVIEEDEESDLDEEIQSELNELNK